MRKRRSIRLRVFFITVLAFFALGGLGHSYAYLVSQMKVKSQFNTGDFDNIFAADRTFSADLVNMASADKEIIKTLNNEVKITDDGKSAELIFKEGIPRELFDENNYLKISYPLDERGTSTLRPFSLNLDKEAGKVSMNVKKAYISIDSAVYEYNYADTVFNTPLVFNVYKSIDIVDDKPIGNLYLKLAESSKLELPQEIKLSPEEVSKLQPAPEEVYEQDGIQVVYFCEFDLHIDQAAAEEVMGK